MRTLSKDDLRAWDYLCKYHGLYNKAITNPQLYERFMAQLHRAPEIMAIFSNDFDRRGQRRTSIWRIGAMRKARSDEYRKAAMKCAPVDKPVISGCMIVKNESENVELAVLSLHDICDEIVVLDTGSTDGTQAMVKGFPKVKLFERSFVPWDFSIARNYALALCAGKRTIILDGDEEVLDFQRTARERILAMTPEQAGSAYVSFMHSTGANDWREIGYMTQPRVFSLEGTFHYEGSPHNEPKYGKAELVMPDLCLAHWREQKTTKEGQRNDRTGEIMEGLIKSIEDANYTGAEERFKVMDSFRRHYMVAKLSSHLQDFVQAAKYCEAAFTLYLQLDDNEKARMVSFLLLGAGIHFRLGKLLDVAKYAAKHRAYCGPCADNSFYGFAYFQAAGDPIMALDYGKEYLSCIETDRARPIWHTETFDQWDDVLLRVELTEYWLENHVKINSSDNRK